MAKSSFIQSILAGITFDSGEFWWEVAGGGWATAVVLLLLLFLQLVRVFLKRRTVNSDPANLVVRAAPANLPLESTSTRISGIISDANLKDLIANLDGKSNEGEKWEEVITKKNGSVSYHAKFCRPKRIRSPLDKVKDNLMNGLRRCVNSVARRSTIDGANGNDFIRELKCNYTPCVIAPNLPACY